MPDDQKTGLAERRDELRRRIEEAFDDPRPSIPAEEVFGGLRARIAADRKADESGAQDLVQRAAQVDLT